MSAADDLMHEVRERRERVRELLARAPGDYAEIRELWKAHSLAEDAHDIGGLMATLTEDCVYELVQTGHSWEGHEGATQFYVGLLTAFPDIEFNLTSIVIGPQGVCEEAVASGTHAAEWLGWQASGERATWRVVIFFPWDPDEKLFTGERVYTFSPKARRPFEARVAAAIVFSHDRRSNTPSDVPAPKRAVSKRGAADAGIRASVPAAGR